MYRKIRSTDQSAITWQSLVLPDSNPWDWFFYMHQTPMKNSYILIVGFIFIYSGEIHISVISFQLS